MPSVPPIGDFEDLEEYWENGKLEEPEEPEEGDPPAGQMFGHCNLVAVGLGDVGDVGGFAGTDVGRADTLGDSDGCGVG